MKPVPRESSPFKGHRRTLKLEPLEKRLLLQADWTFMVYLDGDNNLESAAIDDFLEMAHVGSTADVNVVVQFDRSAEDQATGGFGYTDAYGDWADTRRGLVAKDDVPNASWGTSIGEANMGDPGVLQAFLTYAMTNYQADHYALILWDHGNAYDGAEYDDTDGDNLTLSETSDAMGGALTAASVGRFDLLNFDGCLMNIAEAAHQFKDVANVMVGSEDTEPLDGLPYDQVLGGLTAMPTKTPIELAEDMGIDYLHYYNYSGTYAVIDLQQMGVLSDSLSNFGQTFMSDGNATDRYQLSQHWQTAPRYLSPDFGINFDYNLVDIGVLMTDISGDPIMSQSIRDAADDVLGVYGDTVIASYTGTDIFSAGSGLAIYLPDNTYTVDPDYNATNLSFAADTQWDEFLNWWTGVPEAAWTFMVYMDGDNNLEPYAIQDFLEMASIGSTDAVNIVVEFDRAAGYDASYGDWTDTRRGLVSYGDQPYDQTDPNFPPTYFAWGQSIGEANMADPDTLADFINWAMTTYPAQNYALTLWDHGGGLVGAIEDYDTGGPFATTDIMSVAATDQALQAAPDHINVLRFDACEMSTLEVAYQLRNDADYMISSEDYSWLVSGEGGLTPYDQVLGQLVTDPAMSARSLSDLMARLYFQSWSVGNLTVMNQVIDLSKVDALASAVGDVAQAALTYGTTADRVLMEQHRVAAPYYPSDVFGGPMRDLGTWLNDVANDQNISSQITDAASTALGFYQTAIVSNYAAPGTATGLDIYMPGETPQGFYSWQEFTFADDTMWDEFLSWWASNQVVPVAVFVSGSTKVSIFDTRGILDIDPANLDVKLKGSVVKSITIGGEDPMYGLGIIISGATSVGSIKDKRTAPDDIAFIATNTGAKKVQVNSDIDGEWLNGRSLAGIIFPSDIDGDGNVWDTTSFYFGGGVGKLQLEGSVAGGAYIGGPLGKFQMTNGDLMDDFLVIGDAGKIQFSGLAWGWVWNRLYIDGNVKKLDMPDGTILSGAIVDITGYVKKADIGYIDAGYVDIIDPLDSLAEVPVASFDPGTFNFFYGRGATLRVGDGISKLNVVWFTPGSITYDDQNGGDLIDPPTGTDQRYFITYLMSNVLTPSIDKFEVEGGVANARILAGTDLGADLLPGGTGANADTYGVGYIGKMRVGTMGGRQLVVGGSFVSGGTEAIMYGTGSVGDSLIAAGLFAAPSSPVMFSGIWGGSGYNLVSQHDNFLFEDGSYIGKIQMAGRVVSRYNEIEAVGNDLDTNSPPQYPYFVPFGIGSYMIGQVNILQGQVSTVTGYSAFGVLPRYPYVMVELPRGLGANA